MPVLNPEALIDNRVQALIAAHDRASILKAELDLSGGIDSAVMAGLLVEALGPENVILVHSGMSTNPEQTARAEALAEALGCPLINIDLSDIYERFVQQAGEAIAAAYGDEALNEVNDRCNADKTILGSIRSTLRAPVGRAFNRLLGGGLRHGTGNECEDRFLRFYQKGGDGEVDSNPIAMLSKGEVYQLAFALGKRLGCEAQYRTIIEATPSPDLWGEGDAHSDEAELLSWTGAPFTYGRINPETGEYSYVGTIERVSRFLDTHHSDMSEPDSRIVESFNVEDVLFDDNAMLDDLAWPTMVTKAKQSGYFDGFSRSEVETFLAAARKVERITRHKMNPNCPSYGDRASLVEAGILTNELPAL